MPSLYHATFTCHLKSILKVGLIPGLRPVWAKGNGEPYHCGDYVYAFESHSDAVAWASKMGYAFYQDISSSQVCILTIDSPFGWQEDDNDPLGHAGCVGKWYKRKGSVDRLDIIDLQMLTPDLVKAAIAERTEKFKKGDLNVGTE